MNPIFGLMKMVEFGLDKAGVRESMESRQAKAGGAALEQANNPLQSAVADGLGGLTKGTNPNQSPAMPMSPMMPMDAKQAPMPDLFDQAMGLMERFNSNTGPKSPFQMILERTDIVKPTNPREMDADSLMKMIEAQRKKSPFEMMIGGQ